jgi:hypothetical protein
VSFGAESVATAPAQRHGRRGRAANAALRGNVMGAIVLLLLQFGLGMGVNLYETMPAADHGKSVFAAFGRAVADGPVVLALHALLGTLLIGAGVGAFTRSLRTGQAAQRVLFGYVATLFLTTAAAASGESTAR